MSSRRYILDLFGPEGPSAAAAAYMLAPTFVDEARETLQLADSCELSVTVTRNVRYAIEVSALLLTVDDALGAYLEAKADYKDWMNFVRHTADDLRSLLASWDMFALVVGPGQARFLTDVVGSNAALTRASKTTNRAIKRLELATAEAVFFRPVAKAAEQALAELTVALRRSLPGSIVHYIFVMVGTSPY